MAHDPNDPARDPNAQSGPVSRTPRATTSRSSPVGFIILAVAIIAAVVAFMMLRDDASISQAGMNNPPAAQTTPDTPPAKTQ